MRIAERVGYGQAHVGHAELGLEGAVAELHHGMDYGLRVHGHSNVLRRAREEPAGLYHLEALVHHRRGVDGHLGAHVPVGMAQGVGRGLCLQLVDGAGAEWTAGGREDNAADGLGSLPLQTLEDGRVLAVDGQQLGAMLAAEARNQLTGGHQCLLVGQCDAFSGPGCGKHRRQPGVTHHGRHHRVVCRVGRQFLDGPVAAVYFYPSAINSLFQPGHQGLVGNHHRPRTEAPGLVGKQLPVPMCRQQRGTEALRVLGHDVERLRADAARGAHDGYVAYVVVCHMVVFISGWADVCSQPA